MVLKNMKPIIPPVAKEILEKELTEDKFVRKTNYNNNKIYSITYHDSPNLMREIGRLRELTFRAAGGGTGKELDIDDYDIADNPYRQLIVWCPKEKEILGGYRYIVCKNTPTDNGGNIILATSRLFKFSETFIKNYLPYMIELGRSFVQPIYQSSKSGKKGLFALDNLWNGLGALVVNNPNAKYFFGKVTMFRSFNQRARNMILYFLEKHFSDKDNLIRPHNPLKINISKELKNIFTGSTYSEDYKILSQNVRALGENIPPLINAYMSISPTMKTFGTVLNKSFGNVEETCIMVTIDDIYNTKMERHILTYMKS